MSHQEHLVLGLHDLIVILHLLKKSLYFVGAETHPGMAFLQIRNDGGQGHTLSVRSLERRTDRFAKYRQPKLR